MATEAKDVIPEAPVRGHGFFGNMVENIRAGGGSPGKTLGGFLVAWAMFFLILYGLPLPEVTGMDGKVMELSPAGRAARATNG